MKTLFIACWLAVVLTATGCSTTVPLAWQLPEGVKTAEINGYPLAYLESGTGVTTVAVHGAVCDYRCFDAVRQPLGGTGRFVALSLRNSFPEAPDGSGPARTVAEHARDVAAFLEKMNPPVNLIGHSMGGHIVVEVAWTRPELIRKLVLVEANTTSLVAGSASRQNLLKTSAQLESLMKAGNSDAAGELVITGLAGPGAWARIPERNKSMIKANMWPLIHYGKDESWQLRCEEFGALRMPVLLVTGENTSANYKGIVDAQQKCLSSAQIARIPNAGHNVPLQNPSKLSEAVNAFLR